MKKIILIACVLLLNACSTGLSKPELKIQNTCNAKFTSTATKRVANKTVAEGVLSSTFIFEEADKNVGNEITCVAREMFRAHKFSAEYVNFYFKKNNVFVNFTFARGQDVLMTTVFVPQEDTRVMATASTYVPLENTLNTMNGEKSPSFLVDERQGLLTATEYTEVLDLLAGEEALK